MERKYNLQKGSSVDTKEGANIDIPVHLTCTTHPKVSMLQNEEEPQRIRKPLQELSINTNNNTNNSNILDERLRELKKSDMAYEHFHDLMYNLREREGLFMDEIDPDYIHNIQQDMTWSMREICIDWFYDLQTDLKLEMETLFAAINMMDLYLSKYSICRHHLQLIGVTAIMVSSKTYEIITQSLSEWLYLSNDQYSVQQVLDLERRLLKTIDFNVFQVTAYDFIKPWLEILEIKQDSIQTLIIDLLITAVTLNKYFLQIRLSKLVTSIIYLSGFIYCENKCDLNTKLFCDISKYDPFQCKITNNTYIHRVHQILINLLKKGRNGTETSSLYTRFKNKRYLSKKYGKNMSFFDIDSYPFHQLFMQYTSKYE